VLESRFETIQERWGEMAPTMEEEENCLRPTVNDLWVGKARKALLDGLRDIILGNR